MMIMATNENTPNPSLKPNPTDPERTLTMDIQTTEPYLPHGEQSFGSLEKDKHPLSKEKNSVPVPHRIHTFIDVVFPKNIDDLSIFKIHKEILKCCGGKPKMIRQLKDKTLLVEAANVQQAKKLLGLKKVAGVEVQASANSTLPK